MPLKHWQAWGIDHLYRKPVPVFDHPLGKQTLPNVQSKPPLAQLWTIPTRPNTGSPGEEISTSLSLSAPQEAVESNEVTPQPPALQTRQTQCPQLLFIRHAFQPFHQLCCHPLDAFKDLHILPKLWGPELHRVFKVRPHQLTLCSGKIYYKKKTMKIRCKRMRWARGEETSS